MKRIWPVVLVLLCGFIILTLTERAGSQVDQQSQHWAQIVQTGRNSVASDCDLWVRQASDRAQGTPARLEAIQNLAKHCREHRVLQQLTWVVSDPEQDLAVRNAIAGIIPTWVQGAEEPEAAYARSSLIRVLSVPGVRATAVETLRTMAPAEGQREARLIADLRSLRSGGYDPGRVAILPQTYGRDPRVVEYLKELLQTGNRWQRALAASELCGLGDVDLALSGSQDPEPRVRKSLAKALGWFREERGTETLERMSGDRDPDVASEARKSSKILAQAAITPGVEAPNGTLPWKPLLKELSEFRLSDPTVAAKVSADKVNASWLGEPGATDAQIKALEQRIGRRLPPSYRAFLATANGFDEPGMYIRRLSSTDEVEWFHVRNGWAKQFQEPHQNLATSLLVSSVGRDGEAVLLNPEKVEADGEWQTYFFGSWVPGVRPYRDFREYIENELNKCCEWRNY